MTHTPTSTSTATHTATGTATNTPQPPSCADVTGNDGMVNIFDIIAVAIHFGTNDPVYDLDHVDGVTIFDVLIAAGQFGQGCP